MADEPQNPTHDTTPAHGAAAPTPARQAPAAQTPGMREHLARDADPDATVIESTWNGRPMFECSVCHWSTLDPDRMEEHLAGAHTR